MNQTASGSKYSGEKKLYLALELGWVKWVLAFSTGLGERVWQVSIAARDRRRFEAVLLQARKRLGLPEGCEVVSCYEAGREGFWVDRWLRSLGVFNLVVDSSSIEVTRRSRRIKTDRLDADKLLRMLIRYELGERRLWSVVKVPTAAQEDARHLHRELRTLKRERTRLINRIKGLLASQGVDGRMGRGGLLVGLEAIRRSGKSFREGGISRAGNRHVRGIMVDLAWSWLRWQPGSELSTWYLRRFGAGDSRIRRIGIVALARKLLIALWRYWAQDQLPAGAVLKSYV